MNRFAVSKKQVGSCVNLVIDYVCSDGIHQNYPCPYRDKPEKCPHFIEFTEQMEKQLKEKGYFSY